MAASGYTPISLYYSTTASAIPTAGNLANGELAINITDGKIYYKNNSGVVTLFGSTGDVSTISFGTTGLTPSTATGGAVTVAGTLVAANGGTGQSSYTTGDLIYASGSTALSKLAIGTNGYVLQSNGTAPAWVAASSVVGGAAGSNTQVQYNSSGSLAGSANMTFDGTTLTVNGLATTGTVTVGDASGDALTINSSAVSIPNGLNFDSNTFVIDATNNRVGIGTSSPTRIFQISDSNNAIVSVINDGIEGVLNTDGSVVNLGSISSVPLTFETSGTERLRIDSSGNVGIGTSSPSEKLTVTSSSSTNAVLLLNGGSGSTTGAGIKMQKQGTSFAFIGAASWMEGGTSNDLAFSATSAATVQMRLDSSGNLGLGVTPSAWYTGYTAFQIQSYGGSIFGRNNNRDVGITSNLWRDTDGNWKYKTTAAANLHILGDSAYYWYTAASGTAGTTASLTQAMTLSSNGILLVGGTSEPSTVDGAKIYGYGSGNTALELTKAGVVSVRVSAVSTGMAFGVDTSDGITERMRIDSSGNVGIGTSSPSTYGRLALNDTQSTPLTIAINNNSAATTAGGRITFSYNGSSTGYILNQFDGGDFNTIYQANRYHIWRGASDTERMRIDSSGNVGIGTSSPAAKLNPATDGSSGSTTELVRLTNGSGGGSGTGTSLTYYHSLNTGALVEGGRIAVVKEATWTTTASTQDANMQFWTTLDGTATERMRISAAGGLSVGTTADPGAGAIYATGNITAYYSSDRSLKENIKDVDGALEKVCAIGSKTFDWTDEYIASKGGEDGYFVQKSDFGVIAQDVQEVFPQAVRTRQDGTLAVDYEKLATLAFGAIKELVKRVEALESK